MKKNIRNGFVNDLKRDFTPKSVLVDLLCYCAGGFCYAAAVNIFNSPNSIAQGGATGIAILINYIFPALPIGTILFLINIPLFIASFIKYGKNFILKTFAATLILSAIIDIQEIVISKYNLIYTGDRLLAALFGGALCGLGLGIVFSRGATTGGTDIMGKLIKSAMPHISMGRLVMIMDLCVVCMAGVVYKSIESMMYAVIVFFVSSKTLDFVLYGTDKNKLLMIITEKYDEVADVLRSNFYHGVTVVNVENTYDKQNKKMLMTAVHANEVAKVKKMVLSVDPRPFIIITDSNEIRGQGFKPLDNKDEM